MTAAALTPRIEYLENGATLTFAAPFRYLDPSHLLVQRIAGGVATTLVQGSAWSATAGTTDAGGTVTLVASTSGATLRISRATPRSQLADYRTSDTFPAESHELALDKSMLIDQEQDKATDALTARAIRVPDGESVGALPAADIREDKVFYFGSGGEPSVVPASSLFPGDLPGVAFAGGLNEIDGARVRLPREVSVTTTPDVDTAIWPIGQAVIVPENDDDVVVHDGVTPGGLSLRRFKQPDVAGTEWRLITSWLADRGPSVKDFGAAGDGVTDDTAAFQLAIDALAAGEIGSLYLPDGQYMLSAAITANQSIMTGWHIYGQSRARTIITQTADNTPIFEFTMDQMHTHLFEHFTANWENDQTGNNSSAVFKWIPFAVPLGDFPIRSFYNNSIRDIFVGNCCWFLTYGSAVVNGVLRNSLFWGNSVRDIFCATKGGFVNLIGDAGQPHCTFDNIYINGGAAGQVLFQVDALYGMYNVEVNNSSAGMLRDQAGGMHIILHWELEGANYTTNTQLWVAENGRLYAPGEMYAVTLTIAAGIRVRAFSALGVSTMQVSRFFYEVSSPGAASEFYVFNGTPTIPATFEYVEGAQSAKGATIIQALTDVVNTESADYIIVRSWNDPHRLAIPGDASVTLTAQGAKRAIFGVALTAKRTVTLPFAFASHTGCNLFRGLEFTITKLPSAGTGFDIDIAREDGTVIATIPAATASGTKRIVWSRYDPVSTLGFGSLTVLPPQI